MENLSNYFTKISVENLEIKILTHTIWRLVQEDNFAQMTYFSGHSKTRLMHIAYFKFSTFSTVEISPTDHWKKCVTKFQK